MQNNPRQLHVGRQHKEKIMSTKNLVEELAVLDDAIAQLDERREHIVHRIYAAGERQRSLSNVVAFPNRSRIEVYESTSLDWVRGGA